MKRTFDYNRFKLSTLNRNIIPSQVTNLKESIKRIWYLEYNPVIIDPHFNIIDWQHRFQACKELKLPIFYVVERRDADEVMIELNSNQKWWTQSDYINYYASKWVRWYAYVNMFRQKYWFNISVTLAILTPYDWHTSILIKKGHDFAIPEHADEIALTIIKMKEYIEFANTRNFVRALIKVYNKCSKADLNKLISKSETITKQGWTAEYLAVFENKINNWKRASKRISLTK